jgi:hypothetical protein
MKNLLLALSFVFAVSAISSTGCGGSKENTVIQAPASTGMSQSDQQDYAAAQKAAAGNAKRP